MSFEKQIPLADVIEAFDTKKEIIKSCKDCGNMFHFTISEQLSYEIKDFKPPKRCQRCRDMRAVNTSLEKLPKDTQKLIKSEIFEG